MTTISSEFCFCANVRRVLFGFRFAPSVSLSLCFLDTSSDIDEVSVLTRERADGLASFSESYMYNFFRLIEETAGGGGFRVTPDGNTIFWLPNVDTELTLLQWIKDGIGTEP